MTSDFNWNQFSAIAIYWCILMPLRPEANWLSSIISAGETIHLLSCLYVSLEVWSRTSSPCVFSIGAEKQINLIRFQPNLLLIVYWSSSSTTKLIIFFTIQYKEYWICPSVLRRQLKLEINIGLALRKKLSTNIERMLIIENGIYWATNWSISYRKILSVDQLFRQNCHIKQLFIFSISKGLVAIYNNITLFWKWKQL